MFLKKNLITFGLLAAMAAMMASCTNEDLMYNPQLEEYTRAFIKEFGKIDPEQDWNMAQEANVTLNFGSRQAETVKVYAKHENKYYLVADLVQLSGQVTVPIDIPQTTTDLMVYVDGTSYYCKANTQVNCETGGSRCHLIDSKSVTGGGQ